jgi:hypothetical protein
MSFNNNSSTDLSRYSIGEIADLSGVPDFYNAGSSKWAKSGTFVPASSLSVSTKSVLASATTLAAPTAASLSAYNQSLLVRGMFMNYPIQRISASGVSVVPALYENGTSTVGVGVMTSAGIQSMLTGQTSNASSDAQTGTVGCVASNNTTIFSYCFTGASTLSAYTTTNGTTWTAGSVTGIPTFVTNTAATKAWASSAGDNTTYTRNSAKGISYGAGASACLFTVVWCGARFLLIGPGATNFVCSLSTDGLAFGGDNTTAVIGGTAQSRLLGIAFYRNGNNCYLNVGTAFRYSTDGGVTWAASTFAAALPATTAFYKFNKTDPAKIICGTESSTNAYYSTDSGATWSANRPYPVDPYRGVAYKGSTLVIADGTSMYYSTDDGTTWLGLNYPLGSFGIIGNVCCDAYRFYTGITGQPQILVSADGVTWTIATLPVTYNLGSNDYSMGAGSICSFDSNTVILCGQHQGVGFARQWSTTDGGITWTWAVPNYKSPSSIPQPMPGDVYVTPDAGGFGFGLGRVIPSDTQIFSKADTTAGGAFYRTGASAITPVRTGSFAYVRVG